ncbi:SGNH/GDSL hydrolase family protein [Mycobacterium sp. CPCC 205372]|uniref:SGNH/GDSL hydrolase family protein n=1 Tax=Mycobacterium hippophais TaxID=3016340 RepID=A0ABT4PRT2_9MYCO|nr:SGNH/GDSL hydrolase family protein [Mycobacterium hippophais]MCZ8379265.1 SGNH/GDSL hydrolase family protein [Mycobacterium hippophais]
MTSLGDLLQGRRATVVVVVLVLLALVGTGAVLYRPTEPPTASPPGAESEVVASTVSGPSALFIGDDYTMGPSTLSDLGYASLTATDLGWQVNFANQPGTGYISGGEGQRLPRVLGLLDKNSTSFPERFASGRSLYDADIVVLDGGRYDLRYGLENLGLIFEYTVVRAIESWPGSRIVVIAPWLMTDPKIEIPGTDQSVGEFLGSRLRSNPALAEVTFIDPGALGWFDGVDVKPLLADDGVHPNIRGNREIAKLLTSALIRAGLANTI